MNITIFIGGLSGGGAERVVSNLSNYLSRNHDVTILTMTEDKPAYYIDDNVQLKYLTSKSEDSNFFVKNVKRYYNLKKYVQTQKADAFIVFLPVTTNLLLSLRKIIKVPIIVSERGDPIQRFKSSKFQKVFMKYLYPKADNFVFQTNDAKAFYENELNIGGVVIPNAINPEFIGQVINTNPKKRIISVGRLNEQKNFQLLILAFEKICKKFPEYTLEIYGEGPLRNSLKNLIEELGLIDKVFLRGYVTNISEELRDSTLFVLPSNYEGMPNSLMESMALGLPSISTDCPIGGPNFLIDDTKNGFLIPINDEKALVNRINLLLSDKELRDRVGRNSKLIIKKLEPQKVYKQWEGVVLNTISTEDV